MISTVTTTTVTTTTTTTAAGLMGSLGMWATVFLIGFLIVKELVTATESPKLHFFGRALNIGISSLLLVFSTIVAARVWEILS